MNELIKVEINENQESVMSENELIYELDSIESFEDFFIKVSEWRVEFGQESLKTLRKALPRYVFVFNSDAITYMQDEIDTEILLKCKQRTQRSSRETKYKNRIVNTFEVTFPEYDLIGTEIPVPGVGRIDILAVDKTSRRPVIIELKVGKSNPNKQLIAYSSKYENPILISITEEKFEESKRQENISYLTYSEIIR